MRGLLLCLFGIAAAAGELDGVWVGQIPVGRNGATQDIAFRFVQTGTTITGKLYGDYLSSAIKEGSFSGDQINFVVMVQEQAGNQINETRFKYTGSVKDGEMELSRERDISTNAGNGGGVQSRNNKPTAFKLKRLY